MDLTSKALVCQPNFIHNSKNRNAKSIHGLLCDRFELYCILPSDPVVNGEKGMIWYQQNINYFIRVTIKILAVNKTWWHPAATELSNSATPERGSWPAKKRETLNLWQEVGSLVVGRLKILNFKTFLLCSVGVPTIRFSRRVQLSESCAGQRHKAQELRASHARWQIFPYSSVVFSGKFYKNCRST
jgi:hypothetical protein